MIEKCWIFHTGFALPQLFTSDCGSEILTSNRKMQWFAFKFCGSLWFSIWWKIIRKMWQGFIQQKKKKDSSTYSSLYWWCLCRFLKKYTILKCVHKSISYWIVNKQLIIYKIWQKSYKYYHGIFVKKHKNILWNLS